MPMQRFMAGYQRAWQTSDEHLLCTLFTPDACYHNTPFAVQRGHAQIQAYWQRTKLQADIVLSYDIVHSQADSGVAHWRTTYQVTSEAMFALWAASSGTPVVARQAGDPLPRLVLDGMALAAFEPGGLCHTLRIWWHSMAQP